jgi:hypothetical protein
MGWLQIDLRGKGVPLHDTGSARARRLALRERLLGDPDLPGAAAVAIAREISLLELREAADSLQQSLVKDSLHQLLYQDSLHQLLHKGTARNIRRCDRRLRAA